MLNACKVWNVEAVASSSLRLGLFRSLSRASDGLKRCAQMRVEALKKVKTRSSLVVLCSRSRYLQLPVIDFIYISFDMAGSWALGTQRSNAQNGLNG